MPTFCFINIQKGKYTISNILLFSLSISYPLNNLGIQELPNIMYKVCNKNSIIQTIFTSYSY